MNDLTINSEGIDRDTFLNDWKWATSESVKPVLLTAMGDVFAQGESGAVYFIDMVEGRVSQIADDGAAFRESLTNQQFVTKHLFPSRIVQLREAGLTLEPGQVYSHKKPMVLGGEDVAENYEATDAEVHVSLLGQIHCQVKDLPDGATIGDITLE